MAFTSGRFQICASPACDSVSLTTVRESFDEQDRIWVGEQRCDVCGARMLYSRRAETEEERTMAKKAAKKKAPEKSAHRVNTHKADGSMSTSTQVAPPGKRGRPRQQDLPGTEDRAIKPLEDIAAAYADVRDRRIELNREEAELKTHALKLMHKFDKTIYKHDGVEIRVIPGDEDVKVKVKKAGEEHADETGDERDEIELGGPSNEAEA